MLLILNELFELFCSLELDTLLSFVLLRRCNFKNKIRASRNSSVILPSTRNFKSFKIYNTNTNNYPNTNTNTDTYINMVEDA
jgi:hypothetical protein